MSLIPALFTISRRRETWHIWQYFDRAGIIRKMHSKKPFRPLLFIITLMIITTLIGCTNVQSSEPTDISTPTAVSTLTVPPPTATALPFAIRYGEHGIFIEEYQSEKIRVEAAAEISGKSLTPEEVIERVRTELAGQMVLAAAAYDQGFSISDGDVDTRINTLIEHTGGQEVFNKWLSENAYTPELFKEALIRQIAADWQKDRIISTVPDMQDQIHGRQILVRERSNAEQLLRQLQAGSDFDTLAYQYDPLTGGELGWFPRGYLTQPQLDDVVFALQPGEFSTIIETEIGFHIVYVVDREESRVLSPDAREILTQAAVLDWVNDQLKDSQLEYLID